MDLEVSRKLIPHHLLVFEGNAALKSYYRKVVESYDNKLQSQLFNCQICYSDLILHHTRLQSGHRPTKKMNKLLIQMETKYLKKKQITLVTRYLNSPNYLTVRCHACGSINKFPLTTTEAKMKFKKELLKSMLMTKCLDVPEVKKKERKERRKRKKLTSTGKLFTLRRYVLILIWKFIKLYKLTHKLVAKTILYATVLTDQSC
uniref:Uncharacterized protein n=1 Tax=Biomphalaria glabrata TaxID=6526 RepID=A0A2C9L569_BIOGL